MQRLGRPRDVFKRRESARGRELLADRLAGPERIAPRDERTLGQLLERSGR